MNPHPTNDDGSSERQFMLHQVVDRQHGVVASVFEYPAEWQARSDVVWNFQNYNFPLTAFAQIYNPAGTEVIEFLPAEQYFWLNEGVGFYVPGQDYYGTPFLMPMPAADALAQWVVPKYRGNRQGLRVVGGGPAPQLAQKLNITEGAGVTEDASVKVEYAEHGRLYEEEFYGMKFSQDVPYYGPQGMMVQINWGFARLWSFRAEKGAFDAAQETFWRVARSVKVNPRWGQIYAQVMQQIKTAFDQQMEAGYANIQAAVQMSKAISANNDAMLASFEQQRQAARQSSVARSDASDRSPNDGFDEYIRGVETVNDPYHGESQQDYNYQYHWTNGSGEYQHSNDPFFNPNIGSNQNWTIMTPKKS
ncbi:MAG TPA: hypothetical protein VD861_08650 [Pyrinomonadaceae bacterium]|nr:hypothetical protein [Pyrinomonadaceae bacterium]